MVQRRISKKLARLGMIRDRASFSGHINKAEAHFSSCRRHMKVLQIVPSLSLVYGGPSQMVMGLSAALAAADVQVTVLTTDSNGDVGQLPLAVPLETPVQQDGYEVIYFRCAPFRRYKFSANLLNWLATHAHEYDLAHIHALFSPVSTAAAMVARRVGLPYILRPLGTLDPADLQKKKQMKRLYGQLLERPNLVGAAAVHFTADQEAKVSERFGVSTRDLVIPLGVSLPEMQLADVTLRSQMGIPDDMPLLLFMSRIEPKKGLDLLIPALEQLIAAGAKFHFVLAGANPQDPEYEAAIKRQIQASPLGDRTTLTGFVAGSYKTALLQAADLFVLPSYYENFGIAVAEAMAVGTPVVISDQVHIWQEIEQADAGWVTPCDATALAETLQTALAERSEWQRRGVRAREHANTHYSWQAIAQRMIQAYGQVLRPGEGRVKAKG
jgi:glycosyltransferase involved in cell wall biosynthesis